MHKFAFKKVETVKTEEANTSYPPVRFVKFHKKLNKR